MFLDEKLYQHVINRNLQDAKDFQTMVNELYRICEDHWKPKFSANMTYANGKLELDKVFNAWNLFIKRLEKEEYPLIDILSKYCSYKDAFMNNPEAKRIYNLGK